MNNAQSLQQQLVQLANTQNATGGYLFAGSRSNGPAFSVLPSGQTVFNGDAATNQVQIAPSLNVASSISGQNIFMNVAAGTQGVAVSAAASNSGTAYAVAQGLTNPPQASAEGLAGTQFDVSFAAGSGSSLTYQVTSGHGVPGSAGYNATSGVVASGGYIVGSDLTFGGIQVQVSGTPAAGDSFAVQPGTTTNLFQTVRDLAAALGMPQDTGAERAQSQQALQNVIANINGAQTGILSAQATLGTSLAEIQTVQNQTSTQSANASTAMTNLQSANLPQVLAAYSESLTALQAAQLSFAKLQHLSLFQYIVP
jgi:flagellar hook-associated protein 3 FlgL